MEIGQRLIIIEKARFRHQVRHHVARPGCFGFEMYEMLAPERRRGFRRILDEELFDPCRPVRRRHPGEGEVAVGLEMAPGFLKRCAALLVHEPGHRIAPDTFRIGDRRPATRFDMQGPARAEPAEEIVHAGRDRDPFFGGRAFKVGPAIADRALQAAILVEDNAGRNEAGPFEIICKACRTLAVFTKVQHA